MFLDESGFLLVPSIAKTWAPRGHTPLLPVAGNWTKLSAISALSLSPKRKRLALYLKLHPNKNIRAEQVVYFLRHLLRHLRGCFILLWDRSRTHRAGWVQRFLDGHPRIHPHFFPGYAPELNPDEFVWTQIKRALANSVPKDLVHLQRLLKKPVRRLQHSPKLLWSCIRASDLPWP